jgi:hypothetical protein
LVYLILGIKEIDSLDIRGRRNNKAEMKSDPPPYTAIKFRRVEGFLPGIQ